MLKRWADLLISESSNHENDGDDIAKEPRQYARKLPKIRLSKMIYTSHGPEEKCSTTCPLLPLPPTMALWDETRSF